MENQTGTSGLASKRRIYNDPEYRAKVMQVVMAWRKKNQEYDQYTKQYWREYARKKENDE